ncbi:MAG: hypothetical protein H5U40_18460, partial [Polyangiaceae bacterium]|nr:hypothetical protein [Polyangiaceae bacterium]
MGTGTVWVLNLDAELELASRGRYRPTARVAELVRHHRAPLEALLPRGDIVLDAAAPDAYMGLRGRAYCPTPSALEALARVGAIADAAPSFEVLRAVNDRAFAHSLGATLPSEAFLTSESALDSYLRDAEELEGGFLIKKRWSMSGRGHRRVGRALGEAERKHVRALLREDGGFLVEPFVAIEREASMHG